MIEIELDQLHGPECPGLGMPTARHLTKEMSRLGAHSRLLPNSFPPRRPLASMRTKAAQPSHLLSNGSPALPYSSCKSSPCKACWVTVAYEASGGNKSQNRHLLLDAFPQHL